MFESAMAIAAGYALGSVPVAWIAGRFARGVDIRERGSGNVGASNIWQSVSKALVVPVGLAQIAQGLLPVLLARWLDAGDGVAVAAGLAAVVASDWSPWLGFAGGRGIGTTIGVLLGVSWPALGAFVALALAGVALRAVPQGVGLGLLAAAAASVVAGDSAATAAGCSALAGVALLKRLVANGSPAPDLPRPDVWRRRLIYDRDITDRDAWVRRESASSSDPKMRTQ